MIKVNLRNNRVSEPTKVTAATFISSSSDGGGSETSQLLLKVIMMGVFVGGLIVFETQNLNALKQRSAAMATEIESVGAEAAAKAKEVEAVKDIESQARELEDKLKLFKTLSRLRLREVKTLDFMQSSIPEKVWLSTLTYQGEQENMEIGRLNFIGRSLTTEDLTEFVKRLEESAYLNEVIVVKNQETSGNGKAAVREFQFTAQVEVQK